MVIQRRENRKSKTFFRPPDPARLLHVNPSLGCKALNDYSLVGVFSTERGEWVSADWESPEEGGGLGWVGVRLGGGACNDLLMWPYA